MLVRRFSLATFLVGLLANAAVAAPAQGETLLRWKYEVGQKYRLKVTQDMQMKMVVREKPVLVTTTWTMDTLWEVTDVDERDTATLEQTVNRIQMKIQGPQGVMMEYDSQSAEEPRGMAAMLAPLFNALVGKPHTLKMGAQGRVEEMTIPQGMAESMAKLPGGAQLAGTFSEEGLKDVAEIVTFPEDPVSPGDTWTSEASMKNPVSGDMHYASTMRYVGPETRDGRELERIDVEIKLGFGEGEKAMIEVTDQAGSGTVYFDNELGQFVAGESKITTTMQISVGKDKMQHEMEVVSSTECTPVIATE